MSFKACIRVSLFFGLIIGIYILYQNYSKRQRYELLEKRKLERKVFDGELEPPYPKELKGVMGADINENLVPDIVERRINREFGTRNERIAAKDFAKKYMELLLYVENGGEKKVIPYLERAYTAKYCLNALVDKYSKKQNISLSIYDGIELQETILVGGVPRGHRNKLHKKVMKHVKTGIYVMYTGVEALERCDFELEK